MRRSKNAKASEPPEGSWQKSSTPNLYRYRASGTYFARARIGGKLIRRSLQTSTYSVAVLRLNDLLKEHRALSEAKPKAAPGPMTFLEAADEMMRRVDADPSLKPSAKAYRRRCLETLLRSWPDLTTADVRKITGRQCQDWAAQFAQRYAPTFYNNTVGTLRMALDVAVKSGVRFGNPGAEVGKVSVRPKRLALPSQEQFGRLVKTIEDGGGRFSRDCADLIRFLAYGGFRKSEAHGVTWADCDFEQGTILVRGHEEHGTKNGEHRRVPMIPPMRELLMRLRAAESQEGLRREDRVMQVQECQKAIDRGCRALGIPRFTHHDLRHLFATRCIESGVDVPTVSRWLGHRDGGALAMRTYGHLRNEHSISMAQMVRF